MNKHEEARIKLNNGFNFGMTYEQLNFILDVLVESEATEKQYEERLDLLSGRLVDKEQELEELKRDVKRYFELMKLGVGRLTENETITYIKLESKLSKVNVND